MKSPIKFTIKTEIFPILLILVAIASSIYFYLNFPERTPIYWNVAGEVDNWGPPALAVFMLPAILIITYLLFLFLPLIDPKKEKYQEFQKAYFGFRNVLMLFMGAIYYLSSFNILGHDLPINTWMPVIIGVMFIVMGHYLKQLKSNWFIGIRTPWTLSSETVWDKTHQVGSKVFMLGGFLMALGAFAPLTIRMPLFLVVIFLIILGTVGYSYFAYREENKEK